MKNTKLIYISGPLTTSGFVEINIRNAILVAEELYKFGLQGYVPHLSFFWNMVVPGNKTYKYWLRYDFNIILRCDALLRIDGESYGANKEVEFATKHKIPVYFSIEDLLNKEVRKQEDLFE